MRSLHNRHVVVYDGNKMIIEWADLMTAGHLFIEGKRAYIESQVVMELRTIEKCSPSFVSKCQIIYLGNSLVSRWNKFEKLIPETHPNYSSLKEALIELYDKNFESVSDDVFLKLLKFASGISSTINSKSMLRLIVWMQAMLMGDHVWIKQFGGSCFDFMLTGSYELVSADSIYYQEISYPGYKNYLLVPTKKNSVTLSAIN